MTGEERRNRIREKLKNSGRPLSGGALAKAFAVSRQVIVQDIALLRAAGDPILSTARGYVLPESSQASRVYKVRHKAEETEEELNLLVDLGGSVEDVFIYHKVYGLIRAPLKIRSRRDVQKYLEKIESGESKPLSGATSGYHYHTVTADSEETLDLIQKKLLERGFLARLQDYEPVSFGREENKKQERN